EELQADELQKVTRLPDPEVGPERLARTQVVEGVRLLKMLVPRHPEQQRPHHAEKDNVDRPVLERAVRLETIVAKPFAEDDEYHEPGDKEVGDEAEDGPVRPGGDLCGFGAGHPVVDVLGQLRLSVFVQQIDSDEVKTAAAE